MIIAIQLLIGIRMIRRGSSWVANPIFLIRYPRRMSDVVTLVGLLEAVHDRSSFLAFVAALAKDRREEVEIERTMPSPPCGPGARGWQNGSIESFLERAAAWAEAVHQLPDERAAWFPEAPS